MPLGALKLLDWVLRYRHQIELVKDPATELSGLFPLASSPWAPFRREVSSEASVTPHYVLKVGDIHCQFEMNRLESMYLKGI
jgi:hypothetical protein